MRGVLAAAVAMMALLAGCTGGTGPSDGGVGPSGTATGYPDAAPTAGASAATGTRASLPDPCLLVTGAEAAAAVGEAVGAGVPQPDAVTGQRTCGYAAIASAKLVTVSVWRSDPAGFERLRAQAQAGGDVEDVSGLGEGAFRSAGLLTVGTADVVVSIFVSGLGSGSDVVGPLRMLAQAALGRL